MSGGEAADGGQDRPAPFIIMYASETFDGQERVFSRAAYDLQVLATAHSASCGHPGFVPDDYLEHLDGLSIETTITAAELCVLGTWKRVDGGYRVLDWEAVEVCLDQVRQRRGEDPQALAWDREGEAKMLAQMAAAMVVTPLCAVCGTPSSRVEVFAPGHWPAGWDQWPSSVRDIIVRHREPGQWYLVLKGVATENGYGDPIDAGQAGQIAQAFRPPVSFAQVHTAGLYDDAGFCEDCDAPYCYRHWHVSESGYGHCPRGHGKSLDPHWSPLAVDPQPVEPNGRPAIRPLKAAAGQDPGGPPTAGCLCIRLSLACRPSASRAPQTEKLSESETFSPGPLTLSLRRHAAALVRWRGAPPPALTADASQAPARRR